MNATSPGSGAPGATMYRPQTHSEGHSYSLGSSGNVGETWTDTYPPVATQPRVHAFDRQSQKYPEAPSTSAPSSSHFNSARHFDFGHSESYHPSSSSNSEQFDPQHLPYYSYSTDVAPVSIPPPRSAIVNSSYGRYDFAPRDSYSSFSASYPPPSYPSTYFPAAQQQRQKPSQGQELTPAKAYGDGEYESTLSPMLQRGPKQHSSASASASAPAAELAALNFHSSGSPPSPLARINTNFDLVSSKVANAESEASPRSGEQHWGASPSSLSMSPTSPSSPSFHPPPPRHQHASDSPDAPYSPSSASFSLDSGGEGDTYPPRSRSNKKIKKRASGRGSRAGSGGAGRPISPITGLPTKVLAKRMFPPRDAAKRRFFCPFEGCEKAFGRPSARETHLRSHNGVRPFACPITTCGRPFSVFSNLKRHMIVSVSLHTSIIYSESLQSNDCSAAQVHPGVDFRGITVHDLAHLEYDPTQTPPLFFSRQLAFLNSEKNWEEGENWSGGSGEEDEPMEPEEDEGDHDERRAHE
ncbi:hypothetical protein P7C70_g5927, partial [Phenoliferia sp. Uapishka_3]